MYSLMSLQMGADPESVAVTGRNDDGDTIERFFAEGTNVQEYLASHGP